MFSKKKKKILLYDIYQIYLIKYIITADASMWLQRFCCYGCWGWSFTATGLFNGHINLRSQEMIICVGEKRKKRGAACANSLFRFSRQICIKHYVERQSEVRGLERKNVSWMSETWRLLWSITKQRSLVTTGLIMLHCSVIYNVSLWYVI